MMKRHLGFLSSSVFCRDLDILIFSSLTIRSTEVTPITHPQHEGLPKTIHIMVLTYVQGELMGHLVICSVALQFPP
jgi:hypothetical protein